MTKKLSVHELKKFLISIDGNFGVAVSKIFNTVRGSKN